MQAVVLAAGEGTRLRPLTADRPKALVEVAGRPLLSHVFSELVELGADELVVVVGYRGDDVVEHYGDGFEGVALTYARQRERVGIADALLAAREHVSGRFLLAWGDYVFGADLSRVLDRHRDAEPAATLLVDEVAPEVATDHGVCRFDDDGDLAGLVEKPDDPPSNVAVTGFFVCEPAVFPACELVRPSDRGEYEFTDAVDLLAYAGHPVELVRADDWLVNVNEPADREQAERLLAGE